jgi:hypothetical protein
MWLHVLVKVICFENRNYETIMNRIVQLFVLLYRIYLTTLAGSEILGNPSGIQAMKNRLRLYGIPIQGSESKSLKITPGAYTHTHSFASTRTTWLITLPPTLYRLSYYRKMLISIGSLCLMTVLFAMLLLVVASPLSDIQVSSIGNVLSTQKELIFDLHVRARCV